MDKMKPVALSLGITVNRKGTWLHVTCNDLLSFPSHHPTGLRTRSSVTCQKYHILPDPSPFGAESHGQSNVDQGRPSNPEQRLGYRIPNNCVSTWHDMRRSRHALQPYSLIARTLCTNPWLCNILSCHRRLLTR